MSPTESEGFAPEDGTGPFINLNLPPGSSRELRRRLAGDHLNPCSRCNGSGSEPGSGETVTVSRSDLRTLLAGCSFAGVAGAFGRLYGAAWMARERAGASPETQSEAAER